MFLGLSSNSKYKRKSKRLRQSTSPEPAYIPDSERQRREKRMRRFEDSNKPAVTAPVVKQEPPVYNADVIDWDAHTIVGTSTKLEKPYLRLTSVSVLNQMSVVVPTLC